MGERGPRGKVERNAEVRRRVRGGESKSDIARELGVSRQRIEQIVNSAAHLARNRARDAVLMGDIEPLDYCQLCGANGVALDMHHADYDKPLAVVWVCTVCHAAADKARNISRKLALVPDAKLYESRDAARYLGVSLETFRRYAQRLKPRSVTGDGRGRNVRLYRAADLDRLRDEVASIRSRTPICKYGHPLTDDNRVNGAAQRNCRACNAKRVNKLRVGDKALCRASQYAVRAALKKLGYKIADHAAGRVVTACGLRLSAGGNAPWRIRQNDELVGEARTIGEIHTVLSSLNHSQKVA